MHFPTPLFLARPILRLYSYFRSGVAVEGRAWFCTESHPFVAFGRGDYVATSPDVPLHIDVEVRFWNRRGARVSVFEVVAADLLRDVELAVATGNPFVPVELDEGGSPQIRKFSLVPKHDPEAGVEAAMGDPLSLQFRASRGSERWARPRVRLTLGSTVLERGT